MGYPNTCNFTTLPFSIVYENNIRFKLEEIDIFIKTTNPPYRKTSVCKLLNIHSQELNNIIAKQSINTLNKLSFFIIIQSGSSEICRLIQREFKTGLKSHYTAKDIAYIYDLNIDSVINAIDLTGLSYIDANNIIDVFKYIYVAITRYKLKN